MTPNPLVYPIDNQSTQECVHLLTHTHTHIPAPVGVEDAAVMQLNLTCPLSLSYCSRREKSVLFFCDGKI